MALAEVVFIGSNPSEASNSNSAFALSTKSYGTLRAWINAAGIETVALENVSEIKTPNNRPLNAKEIDQGMERLLPILERRKFTHIVAIGKTAAKALRRHGIEHLELPHPSGLNRKLNDPKFIEQTIAELKAYHER